MGAPRLAFRRVIFVGMLPKGREAQFFSFYSVVNKSTAFLGPAWLIYFRNNVTTYRNAYASLITFYLVGVPILFFFNWDRAVQQRIEFEKKDAFGTVNLQMIKDPSNNQLL